MELPKNITQIGETNPHCKVYVEDYVISYIKQLNQCAGEKQMAVALYGVRKEEAGVDYLFLYGACRLVFLQKECRHLSQAVLQEAEKQRQKYFADYVFLGYRLLDGEMVEGFHICEQSVCRYVEGYAQFYEKNDAMLAFMLEERQEAPKPETVDQEKYNVVKKRQEERRIQAEEKGGHVFLPKQKSAQKPAASADPARKLRGMKMTAAAVFALLCVTGLTAMGNGEKLAEWQTALRQLMENMSEQQLPDAVQVSNGSAQVGTIVAEDKLNNAILNENAAADPVTEGQDASSGENGQGDAANSQEQDPPSGESDEEQDKPSGEGAASAQGTAQTTEGEQQSPQESAQTTEGEQQSAQGTAQTTEGEQQSPQESAQTTEGEQQSSQESAQTTAGEQQAPQGPDSQPSQDSGTKPAAGPAAELTPYTVQKGDTLTGICVQRYGDDTRLSEICSLNNIENPDDIRVGEKIFLPQ